MTTIYTTIAPPAEGPGYSFNFAADLADAAAPIVFIDDEDDWQWTPFQTADARHSATAAGRLILGWLGDDWDRDIVVESPE